MGRWWTLAVLTALIAGCAGTTEQASTPPHQEIARAYGVDRFGEIAAIRYTFNVQTPDRSIRRSWIWWPAEDRVSMTSGEGGSATTYARAELTGARAEPLKEVDAKFINDR